MSDAGATTEPTVTEDDITVTKSYEAEEFPVPAVAFQLSSERDDAAMVRITDTVPDEVPPEDLGFHPDYGSDHWSVEDGNAVFERRLDPGEEYQTVYGIRSTDSDPEAFMTDPALDVDGLGDDTGTADTEGTDDAATTPGGDSSQAARDVISGKSVEGLDGGGGDVGDVDISGTGAAEASGDAEATGAAGNDESAADGAGSQSGASESGAGGVPTGEIGAALATELREDDLDQTDRELLAEELTVEDAGSEVRLTHLQSRISDLEAYTDALEEFIDEHGPARQLIEDMTDQLESIEEELDALDDRTTENEDDIAALDDRTDANEDDIEALDKGVADINSELDATQDSIEDLRGDIAEINDWRAQITSVLGGAPEGESDAGDEADHGNETDDQS